MQPTQRVAAGTPGHLDLVFQALANPHRREIVHALGLQPYSISGLAQLRGLSLPAIHKHIKALEGAGIVRRRKVGRTNVLMLDRGSLVVLQQWVSQFHPYWGTELESLENYETYLSRIPSHTNDEERP